MNPHWLACETIVAAALDASGVKPQRPFRELLHRLDALGLHGLHPAVECALELALRILVAAESRPAALAEFSAPLDQLGHELVREMRARLASPQPPEPHAPLRAINPHAGAHPITDSPAEIAVALQAGMATRAKFPQVFDRFGERGLRFTVSDACWLPTLCRITPDGAKQQIAWLRSVLEPRGVPAQVLRDQLEELARRFEAAFPARREEYRAFGELAASIR